MRIPFTEAEVNYIKANYESYMLENKLDGICEKLGRSRTSVCKKARQLGLTNIKRCTVNRDNNNNPQNVP